MDTHMLDKLEEAIGKFIDATGEKPKYLYLNYYVLVELQRILKEKCPLVDVVNCTRYKGIILKVIKIAPTGTFYLTSEEFPQENIDTI
jgi:hypothetical protein